MAGTLCIGTVNAEYLIDRLAPNPNAIRDRCDQALRSSLKDALSATLSRWCDRDDPSIWLVRRIDIDVATNTAFASDELSQSIAYSVATSLRDVLSGDGDGTESIRFADAGALLARFLVDAANGDAWSRWYYRRFRGLRMLSTSAGLRTAICDDPRVGLNTLQRLSAPELARVLNALSAADCQSMRRQLEQALDAADANACVDACLVVLDDAQNANTHKHARALWLLVRASAAGGGGSSLNAIIDAVLRVQRMLDEGVDPGAAASLLSGELTQHVGETRDAVGLLERVVDGLKTRTGASQSLVEEGSYFTGFGGAFFILPHLSDVMCELVPIQLHAACTQQLLALLRLLVLCHSMGAGRAEHAFKDPVLRFACGISADCEVRTLDAAMTLTAQEAASLRNGCAEALIATALAAWSAVPRNERAYFRVSNPSRPSKPRRNLERSIGAAAYRVLRAFANRLPGFGDSGCSYLWKNFLDTGARIDMEPHRIVVCVARAPLHLVLSLAGVSRGSYVLPFGEARAFSLFTSE